MRRSELRSAFLLATVLAFGSATAWAQCTGTSTARTCTASVSVSAPTDSKATPYSISQVVSGLTGSVTHVHVTLSGISESPSNEDLNGMELLLVSPSGIQLVILAYPGDGGSVPPSSLLIDDSNMAVTGCATMLTGHILDDNCNGTTLNPGGMNGTPPDGFPNVAAPGSSCTALTCKTSSQPNVTMDNTFNAEAAPNGTWSLYIINNNSGCSGCPAFQFTGWTLQVDATGVAATGTNTAVTP